MHLTQQIDQTWAVTAGCSAAVSDGGTRQMRPDQPLHPLGNRLMIDAGRRQHEDMAMTSVPELTRILAHIAEWQGQRPPLGRADAARRLDEARQLLDEIERALVEIRRTMMGAGRRR